MRSKRISGKQAQEWGIATSVCPTPSWKRRPQTRRRASDVLAAGSAHSQKLLNDTEDRHWRCDRTPRGHCYSRQSQSADFKEGVGPSTPNALRNLRDYSQRWMRHRTPNPIHSGSSGSSVIKSNFNIKRRVRDDDGKHAAGGCAGNRRQSANDQRDNCLCAGLVARSVRSIYSLYVAPVIGACFPFQQCDLRLPRFMHRSP